MTGGAFPAPRPITITVGGRAHQGAYLVSASAGDGGRLTVTYDGRSKTTPLGGLAHAPEALARQLLHELVTEQS